MGVEGRGHDLQIVRQFCAAGVPRVHRDERAEGGPQDHVAHALERELRELLQQRLPHLGQLRRNDGEHFDVDAVEFIQAAPGAALH